MQTRRSGSVRVQSGPQLTSYHSHLKAPPSSNILEDEEEYREDVDSEIGREDDQSVTNGKEQVDVCPIEHYSALVVSGL